MTFLCRMGIHRWHHEWVCQLADDELSTAIAVIRRYLPTCTRCGGQTMTASESLIEVRPCERHEGIIRPRVGWFGALQLAEDCGDCEVLS